MTLHDRITQVGNDRLAALAEYEHRYPAMTRAQQRQADREVDRIRRDYEYLTRGQS